MWMVVCGGRQDNGRASEAITASRPGNERWVPRAVTERAAAVTASRAASSGARSAESPTQKAPTNASPAPVVSTTSTTGAATRRTDDPSTTSTPSAPQVTTSRRWPAAADTLSAVTGSPNSSSNSGSLGTSHDVCSSTSGRIVAAGAGLSTVTTLRSAAQANAAAVADCGVSSWATTTSGG